MLPANVNDWERFIWLLSNQPRGGRIGDYREVVTPRLVSDLQRSLETPGRGWNFLKVRAIAKQSLLRIAEDADSVILYRGEGINSLIGNWHYKMLTVRYRAIPEVDARVNEYGGWDSLWDFTADVLGIAVLGAGDLVRIPYESLIGKVWAGYSHAYRADAALVTKIQNNLAFRPSVKRGLSIAPGRAYDLWKIIQRLAKAQPVRN